ncbi:hypothetical protein AAG570_002761, partial [Ranatra chinensis]
QKGLILGAYDGCDKGELKLTPTAKKFDQETNGKLSTLLKGADIRLGRAEVYTNVHIDFACVAVTGLGPEGEGIDSLESLDKCKENIRIAAGVAATNLQANGMNSLLVEGFTNAEAAAEGASLAVWKYQEYKNKQDQTGNVKLELYHDPDIESFQRGLIKGEAQNLARALEESPANRMTPSIFAQKAVDALCACGVQVNVRDVHWMRDRKMNAFMSVAKGSCETPLLLEIGYCAGAPDEKPVVLIGKGLTFDSGGLLTKPCDNMMQHRGDMAGAAVVVAAIRCCAMLNLPFNIKGLIPLCESMPGGLAIKPGDVVTAINGKSIRIEDTDNEGRVTMTDPLIYCTAFKPCLVITLGTMTDMSRTIGSGCSALFTTSDVVWREMHRAGLETGDRVWRYPMWKYYKRMVTDHIGVDITNKGSGGGGDSCLAAAFLYEFVPPGIDFCHLDITGVGMISSGVGYPYLRPGLMTGRPTRTLCQFFYQMACPHERGDEC